jgi:polar amino acid transport system substrate-binding protein
VAVGGDGGAVGGTTRIVGSVSGGGDVPADIAAMTRKDNGLVRALNEALNTVIENGRYAEVLDRWKLTGEAVPTSEINPPGLPRKPAS